MLERFTTDARRAVTAARTQARRLGDDRISDEHILLALLVPGGGAAAAILARYGVTAEAADLALAAVRQGRRPSRTGEARTGGADAGDADTGKAAGDPGDGDAEALKAIGIDLGEIRRRAEATFGPGALERGPRTAHIPFTKEAKRVLELALKEALRLRSGYVGTEHLLLGALAQDRSVTVAVFRAMEVSPGTVRTQILTGLRQEAV